MSINFVDFTLILVIATAVTGIIWVLDNFLGLPKRVQQAQQAGKDLASVKEPILVEYSKAFFPVLFIVLVFRAFVMEPFRIPSGSMLPTLEVGDFILVKKYAYGLRLPVTRNKILEVGQPKRGDVVVFKFPENPKLDYIKRIIGLPGDHIVYKNKQLTINGQLMELEDSGSYSRMTSRPHYGEINVKRETLEGIEHSILNYSFRGDAYYENTVPAGHYFVMGDNRDDSRDSREWGFLPEDNLVGKAVLIWMNWDIPQWTMDFKRFGTSIQ